MQSWFQAINALSQSFVKGYKLDLLNYVSYLKFVKNCVKYHVTFLSYASESYMDLYTFFSSLYESLLRELNGPRQPPLNGKPKPNRADERTLKYTVVRQWTDISDPTIHPTTGLAKGKASKDTEHSSVGEKTSRISDAKSRSTSPEGAEDAVLGR